MFWKLGASCFMLYASCLPLAVWCLMLDAWCVLDGKLVAHGFNENLKQKMFGSWNFLFPEPCFFEHRSARAKP